MQGINGEQRKIKICDIHAHIVPGIDDGAGDMNMAVALLRLAQEQGAKHIVCTSHCYGKMEKYDFNLRRLQTEAYRNGIDIKLHSGCEIYCGGYGSDEIADNLRGGYFPTINNTDYVLLEFDPGVDGHSIIHYVKAIQNAGYKAVIAHVERYRDLYKNIDTIYELLDTGSLFQCNFYSFINESRQDIKDFAREMLKNKFVSFVGSDAHRTTHRSYKIQDGTEYILEYCDEEYAKDILYRNAEKFLGVK